MQVHLREGKQVVEDAEGVRAREDEPEKGWERPEVLHCYRIGCVRLDGGKMEWWCGRERRSLELGDRCQVREMVRCFMCHTVGSIIDTSNIYRDDYLAERCHEIRDVQ